MRYCKGRVTAVYHHSGCWEVVVEGKRPGTFTIDNLCIWSIVDAEGADWIGREVEYKDGDMRFLDTTPETLVTQPTPCPVHKPSRNPQIRDNCHPSASSTRRTRARARAPLSIKYPQLHAGDDIDRIMEERKMLSRRTESIYIGGTITQSDLATLLDAIGKASVCHKGRKPPFKPKSAEDLAVAIRDGHLFLCEHPSSYGGVSELETTCRELGLSYSHWYEDYYCDLSNVVVEWRPLMDEPVHRPDHDSDDVTFIPIEKARQALTYLESNNISRARDFLQYLCSGITKLPPFTIV